MTIIAEKDRPTIRDLLAREQIDDVELLLFTRSRSPLFALGRLDGQLFEETGELLEELVALSGKLLLTTRDVDAEPAAATLYNVTAVPTVIVRRRAPGTAAPEAAPDGLTSRDGSPAEAAASARESSAELGANVRFLGMPGGYEFSTLLADVVDVSKGRTDLSAGALAVVRAIDSPVHIQVFVTPT